MTENTAAEALRSGDPRAFALLVDQYADSIYRLVMSIVQHQEEAEDITQEVFTTVFTSIGKFKGDSLLSTWMYRIAVNKCQEQLRKQSRQKRSGKHVSYDQAGQHHASVQSAYMHPQLELENNERAQILLSALHQLPDQQRIAFTMHKIDGFSYEEIAAILDTSLSAVESLIFRGRKQLRQLLATYYDEHF